MWTLRGWLQVTVLQLLLLLSLITTCSSHRPGEEFTYLSMFLHASIDEDPDAILTNGGIANSYRLSQQRVLPAHERAGGAVEGVINNMLLPCVKREPIQAHCIAQQTNIAETIADSTMAAANEQLPAIVSRLSTGKDTTPSDIGLSRGENVVRLTTMLTKIIHRYHIRSVVDVPCRAHSHWISTVLANIQYKGYILKYVCVDTNANVLDTMRAGLQSTLRNPKSCLTLRFERCSFWKERLPVSDLVLSWAGLDNMDEYHVKDYLQLVSQSASEKRHRIVIIGSHTGEMEKRNLPEEKVQRFISGGRPLNVRKKPFGLIRPARIIKEVSAEGNDKEMLIYFPGGMFPK